MKTSIFLKSTLTMGLAFSMVFGLVATVHAQESPEKKVYTYSTLQNVGKVIDGGSISVNNVENSLYRVFENQAKALEDIKLKVPDLLDTLASEYNLEPLSDSSWQEYRDAMYMLFDSSNKPEDYSESNKDFRTLRAFFDIYENYQKNQEIMAVYNGLTTSKSSAIQELGLLLPYTEPLAQEFMSITTLRQPRASFNINNAIAYARKHATFVNYPAYHYFPSGDCTNYVSQILENGGVRQVVYDSVYSGWWHKRTAGLFHTHSQSWTLADVFSRYMGVKYTSRSHIYLAKNIDKGNIIAADFDGDGDWDHLGFVTESNDYYSPSCGFYDYKVAQHTSNYLAWTSSKTNGWELIGPDGGTYARIRH